MRVEIFEVPAPVEKKRKLKLFQISRDNIVVGLADEIGDRVDSTSLVSFKIKQDKLVVMRCNNVNEDIGLVLNDNGQLMSMLEMDSADKEDRKDVW